MNFILINWVKYYTKEMAKALKIILIGTAIILTVICIKYKPAYSVELAGIELGYIENKDKLEIKINKYISDTTGNVVFREQKAKPEYKLKVIDRNKKTQESEVIAAVKNCTTTTYKTYAVTVDGNVKATVSSEEEAKTVVDEIKNGVSEEVGLNVGIIDQYTTEYNVQTKENATAILTDIKIAKVSEYNKIQEEKRIQKELEEAKRIPISTKTISAVGQIAGISLARPVSGSITSRYGARSSIRSGLHTGLDIATSSGTAITPIAPGTVTYASYKGSYGNLVIVNHGNGVESYYAHCSQIYVNVGDRVEQNSVISAVGSTGNSTGPHLHLEIRQNGSTLNPENYLY